MNDEQQPNTLILSSLFGFEKRVFTCSRSWLVGREKGVES